VNVTASAPAAPARPAVALAVVVPALGLLVARPVLVAATGHPLSSLAVLFASLLALGVVWPVPAERRTATLAVLAIGIAAFAFGRVLGGGHAPLVTGRGVALDILAAVAEEAFFRRLVFAALAPGGAALAVLGSAGLFAVAHVTVYGWWVLPLDLAAGLVLSWQRWVSGTWTVPALTHVVANVLVLL
jgi:hypothetical protein